MRDKVTKILVVDDSAFVRAVIKDSLVSEGYDVVEASDGKQAVEIYKEEGADLIIMDVLMDEEDGISATKKIKEFNSAARVLICTVLENKKLVETVKEIGAEGYIQKSSWNSRDFLNYINHVITGSNDDINDMFTQDL